MNKSRTTNRSARLRQLAMTGMLMAVELVMWMLRLGQVPVGPLNMSFLTVPVAVGAMLIGPAAGLALGLTFGLTSLYDAMTGASVLTGYFFATHPVHTVFLCVLMRMLMGICTGLIFRAAQRWSRLRWYIGALAAPLLNTLFFMGYIVLFLYQTERVQSIAVGLGATNPLMFVVLLVGVQGLAEAVTCCLVGGTVSRAVDKALR